MQVINDYKLSIEVIDKHWDKVILEELKGTLERFLRMKNIKLGE